MRDKKTEIKISRQVEMGAWETLPIEECIRSNSEANNRVSIYILEKLIAEDTVYTQSEVRKLLQAAVRAGFLVKTGDQVTLAPQYQFEEISDWNN